MLEGRVHLRCITTPVLTSTVDLLQFRDCRTVRYTTSYFASTLPVEETGKRGRTRGWGRQRVVTDSTREGRLPAKCTEGRHWGRVVRVDNANLLPAPPYSDVAKEDRDEKEKEGLPHRFLRKVRVRVLTIFRISCTRQGGVVCRTWEESRRSRTLSTSRHSFEAAGSCFREEEQRRNVEDASAEQEEEPRQDSAGVPSLFGDSRRKGES